jgi:hypothetical protein
MRFNILYSDYKDQQMYRRSIKCDLDNIGTYDVKYKNGHIGTKRYSTMEMSFNIDNHVIEYKDNKGLDNYRVNLLPTDDLVIYTNLDINEQNDIKIEELVNDMSKFMFVNVPKKKCIPDKLKILVDHTKLDELIEKHQGDLMSQFIINVNIYDTNGIFNMIRKYQNNCP